MERKPLSQRPGVKTFLGLILWAALYFLLLRQVGDVVSAETVLLDTALAAVTLLITVAVAAQFVLPVRSLSERLTVIGRLVGSIFGIRGPVIFIEDGKPVESHRERQRVGPGVLLIDQASAAVLRTATAFTRAVGPGVVFTAPGEWLAESLDLRRQVRRVKGSPPESDPEAGGDPMGSLALTQDGIPVAADLSVTFQLDPGTRPKPAAGSQVPPSPFPFNPVSAERAVYGHTYAVHQDLPWTELPLRLVTDLWREEVKGRKLEDLFSQQEGQGSPLAEIQRSILSRLTSAWVEEGLGDDEPVPVASREFELLSSRGIRVLGVGVSNLYLPSDVQEERRVHWRETWAGAVERALSEADQQVRKAEHRAEREAYGTLTRELTSGLRARLARKERPTRKETLSLLLADAVRMCGEGEHVADGSTLAVHLRQALSELSALDEDCRELPDRDVP